MQVISSKTQIRFILISFAFISLLSETLSYYLKGYLGFFALVLLTLFFNSANGRAILVLKSNSSDRRYRFLYIVGIIYFISLVLNAFIWGNGIDDWRFMTQPVILILAIRFAGNFFTDETHWDSFMFWATIVMGVQSIANFFIGKENIGISRSGENVMYDFLIIGGPSTFALKAMLVPTLVWYAWSSSKMKRHFLLLMISFIILSIIVSTFTTSILLLIFAIALFVLISIILPVNFRVSFKKLLFLGITIGILIFGYRITYKMPQLEDFYYRVENLVDDPTSGGYSGYAVKESRWIKNEQSLNSFINSPFWGNHSGLIRNNPGVGGHSSFFDSLGAYGLLGGGLAFILIPLYVLYISLKTYYQNRSYKNLAGLVSVCLLVLAGIVNPFWEGFQPALIFLICINHQQISYEDQD